VKPLLSHALGDGVGQSRQLWIVCADAAHLDLLLQAKRSKASGSPAKRTTHAARRHLPA
jgi:hypothetical protein